MTSKIKKILESARAENIPEGESGLWYIHKMKHKAPMMGVRHGKYTTLKPGVYTYLRRVTDSSIHKGGEIVMEDSPQELESHLEFMIKARGRVLITGLGLGCVIRGVLANNNVDSVVCVERSKDVISLVAPHMDMNKLEIIESDAVEWAKNNDIKFDCAYHDLWTDRDSGEPILQMQHTRLIHSLRDKIKVQGAWYLPRSVKRYLKSSYSLKII